MDGVSLDLMEQRHPNQLVFVMSIFSALYGANEVTARLVGSDMRIIDNYTVMLMPTNIARRLTSLRMRIRWYITVDPGYRHTRTVDSGLAWAR